MSSRINTIDTSDLESDRQDLENEFESLCSAIQDIEPAEDGDDEDFDRYQEERVGACEELANWLGVQPHCHIEFIGSIDDLLQDGSYLLERWACGGDGLRLKELEELKSDVGWGRDNIKLIDEGSFAEYAEQHAADTCSEDLTRWPCNHIDWDQAAEALKVDFQSVEYDGNTYLYESR